jgi:hypothetical protein
MQEMRKFALKKTRRGEGVGNSVFLFFLFFLISGGNFSL